MEKQNVQYFLNLTTLLCPELVQLYTMKLVNTCRDSWQSVISKVNRSVVFVDEVCAECLHWNGGAMALLGGGAVDVKQFSSFEVSAFICTITVGCFL